MGRKRVQPPREEKPSQRQRKAAIGPSAPGLSAPGASTAAKSTGSWLPWLFQPAHWAMALIVLTTIAAYSNSFRGEFIFDDMKAIAENPTIHSLWPLWPIFCPPNQGETVMDRPILNLTLAVNYAMGGVDVWGYHAGNLLIHAVASLLFFGILRRTFLLPSMHDRWGETALPLSCIIALLWAIHPLQTESVTYIVQRAESLMGLFYLLTFYCVIRGATARRRGVAWYAAASFACVIGMASKEVMASVPLTVLLYDRAFLTGSFRETLRRRWVLYFVLASTWGLLVWLILSGVAVYGIGVGMSWWAYFGTQCWAIVHYLRLCVWPYPLLFDYGSYLATGFWNVAPYAAMLVSLGIATMVALWRWPKLGFLGFCFFAILAPTSSFIPACVTQTVAEHRMYLPLAVVLTALTVGVWTAAQRQVQQKRLDAKTARVACGILAGVAAAVFAMLTLERNRDYRTEESIWRDSMIKAPYSARAYVNLGAVLLSQGKASEALPLFKKAVAIDPNYADAHNNLGNALAQDGQTQAAIVQFEKTIQLAPRYANAYYNLATVLSRCNRNEEAIAQFEKALELNPQYLEAHCNLAATLVADGRLTEAISHYRAALQIDPNLIGACSKLAELLATHPDASVRNGQEAVGLAERAARLSPGLGAGLLDTLAAAYAEAGRFPEAVQAASSALDIASQQENAPLVKSLTAKIELYRKGIPFRQTPQTPRERP